MMRIGVDISSVGDLARRTLRSRNDALSRFWTANERSDSAGRWPSLAARWSAKEATMKALGTGIGMVDPADIEVMVRHGRPMLRLAASALEVARELGLQGWHLSLSRDDNYAIAFVVATGGGEYGRGE